MKVLIVDDNASLARGLSAFIEEEGYVCHIAGSVGQAIDFIQNKNLDLIITDLCLPDGEGLTVIETARKLEKPPEVILMTAFGSVETAVEAMKLGAMDYLTKPVPPEEFLFRVRRVAKVRQMAVSSDRLRRANETLLETLGWKSPLDDIVGSSSAITQVKALITKSAPYPTTILLTGETGTGKELAARALHSLSPWSSGPFVRVNCASIPASLFEAELFGHEKGAFTDAKNRRIGKFEAADGGTLFLDEVGEVPLSLQAKLLRVLQEKEIVRLGSSEPIKVQTRIVAATNRDLEAMVKEGSFREDLLYRLMVLHITLPPLRERIADINVLVEHLLERLRHDFGCSSITLEKDALPFLEKYPWPGNIRELKNALERAVVLSENNRLSLQAFKHLSSAQSIETVIPGGSENENRLSLQDGLIVALEELERNMINTALNRESGVKSRAAALLKIPRTNLLYRMKRLGFSD